MCQRSLSARRAWIEMATYNDTGSATVSLSARRAWIEIQISDSAEQIKSVALRKESVDRNASPLFLCQAASKSLTARRAWIEMRSVLLKT